MSALALLFTLAAIGIAETVYLIRARWEEEKPVCPIGNNCHVVLTSKYNHLFGVHNDLLGFVFYLVSAVLIALLVLETWLTFDQTVAATLVLATMVAGSSLFSLILVFIQWRLIKAWCFWCLMSAFTNWLMAIIVFSNLGFVRGAPFFIQ